MKTSQLFSKSSKTAPADEQSKSASLLLRAGYVHKEMAGVYAYLPLGLRVLNKIIAIIREEMNALGGQEVLLTALQKRQPWEASDRWSDDAMDVWFKTKLKAGGELGLAPTHEEPITHLMTSYISSYKDLPVYAYQFQTKFRNELRAKSGIMRTREFIMKDLYSFSKTRVEHDEFYEKVAKTYARIFDRLGIGDNTYRTFASGGSFSKFSDEFQTICDAGEDLIYLDEASGLALNEEVLTDENLKNLGLERKNLKVYKAAEVGNIFTLGYKYADALGLEYNSEDGKREKVFMGSYGIGPSRLMGVIAELSSDEKGLCWPETVAPFQYYLVALGQEAEELAEKLHARAPEKILFDDSKSRAGEKFADAELIGLPFRVVISGKTLEGNQLEIQNRKTGETTLLTIDEFEHKLV